MGYYYSKAAIFKVQGFLDEMLKSDGDITWTVADHVEPNRVAYAIRQGIKSAGYYKFEEYAHLGDRFIIRSKPGQVIAELRSRFDVVVSRTAVDKLTIKEANNLNSLVGAAIKHKADEMYFPNILNPNEELLNQLYLWSSEQGYKIVLNETGVTLTKKDIGELEWKPEEPREPREPKKQDTKAEFTASSPQEEELSREQT